VDADVADGHCRYFSDEALHVGVARAIAKLPIVRLARIVARF
jgi:hypothetical protein